jgi:hypothetical protein
MGCEVFKQDIENKIIEMLPSNVDKTTLLVDNNV